MPQPPSTTPHQPLRPEPPLFDDKPNAQSKEVKTVNGAYTYGRLNEIPSEAGDYTLGVTDDMGNRRTMEDTHAFVWDFAGIQGQGLFAVFDGHSGKHAAEWCGQNFHEYLLKTIVDSPTLAPAEALAATYNSVDAVLTKFAEDKVTSSGCTAVTVFLRLEDDKGQQPWAPPAKDVLPAPAPASERPTTLAPKSTPAPSPVSPKPSQQRFMDILSGKAAQAAANQSKKEVLASAPPRRVHPQAVKVPATRRVLYTANVGDARAVLARNGRAIRLSYDHKGMDLSEVNRIRNAGGFVLNNRINGVLAVTRSLGDSAMKEYVIGRPYTTECELSDVDQWLIIACDGLWDVTDDQTAVDVISNQPTADAAAKALKQHAMGNYTQDNVTVMVVKFAFGRVVDQGRA